MMEFYITALLIYTFPTKLYSVILYQNGFSSDLITEKIIRDNIIHAKQKGSESF